MRHIEHLQTSEMGERARVDGQHIVVGHIDATVLGELAELVDDVRYVAVGDGQRVQLLQVAQGQVEILERRVAYVQIDPARVVLVAGIHHAGERILDVGHVAADERLGVVGEALAAHGRRRRVAERSRIGARLLVDVETGGQGWGGDGGEEGGDWLVGVPVGMWSWWCWRNEGGAVGVGISQRDGGGGQRLGNCRGLCGRHLVGGQCVVESSGRGSVGGEYQTNAEKSYPFGGLQVKSGSSLEMN